MILIVTGPCHCLSLTFHNLILVLFLLWSIKAIANLRKNIMMRR